jgi:hypothetical protein
MGTESTFYYPVDLHKDSGVVAALAPLLYKLPLQAQEEEVAVLALGVGNLLQGFYVYDNNRWKFAVPMQPISVSTITGGAIDIYANPSADVVVDTSATIYRNGQVVSGNVVNAGPALYAVLTPGANIPPKPPGPDFLAYTAVTDVSGHRVMKIAIGGVTYASSDNLLDTNLVLGISMGAAVAGATVDVQLNGVLTEPSWSWIPGLPVFCGVDGFITQVAPTAGFVIIVGQVISPQSIVVTIKTPIIVGD